ncbi:hypothetical protein LUZ60_012024 [Juncus effusus]|nr:hypothetical protein LUZ60_012024 [Juncus effusus]
MFLTDKYRSVPVPPSPYQSVPANHLYLSQQFNDALSSRLASLVSPTVDLSWLSRAVDVLSLTLADATSLLLLHTSYLPPSPLLDSTSLALLDSCNSISNFADWILNRLMFLRFSLRTHKHTLTEALPLPEISKIHHLSSSCEKAPHSEISPVLNTTYAVEAVSALIIRAVSVILSGKGNQYFQGLKVHSEIFLWGKEFNKVVEALYMRLESVLLKSNWRGSKRRFGRENWRGVEKGRKWRG